MTTPNTASTDGMLAIIRTRLLTFVPMGDDDRTLLDRLGTYGVSNVPRLWLETVPDDVSEDQSSQVTLWGLMQVIPARQAGDDGGYMRRGELEVQLFGRPRRAAAEVSAMADLVEQALFRWINYADQGGYIKPQEGLTRTKIEYDTPADRELAQINLRVRISYAPQFLTRYST
jgi:hypothetical protein